MFKVCDLVILTDVHSPETVTTLKARVAVISKRETSVSVVTACSNSVASDKPVLGPHCPRSTSVENWEWGRRVLLDLKSSGLVNVNG